MSSKEPTGEIVSSSSSSRRGSKRFAPRPVNLEENTPSLKEGEEGSTLRGSLTALQNMMHPAKKADDGDDVEIYVEDEGRRLSDTRLSGGVFDATQSSPYHSNEPMFGRNDAEGEGERKREFQAYYEEDLVTPGEPNTERAVVEAILRALIVELQNPKYSLEDKEKFFEYFTRKDLFKAVTYPLVTLLMFMANISFLQGSKDALPGYPLLALSFGISGMTDSTLCGLWTGTVLDDMLADAIYDSNESVRAIFSNVKKDWRYYLHSGAILGTGLVSAFPLGALTWNKIEGKVKKATTSAISFLGEASLTTYSAQQEMTEARFQVRLSKEERAMLSSAKAFLLERMHEARPNFLTWGIGDEELTLEDVFSILNDAKSAEAPSMGQDIAVGTVKKGAKAGLIGYTGVTYMAVEMIVNAIFAAADANPADYLVLIQGIVLPATASIMYFFGALMQEGAESIAKGAYKALESLIKEKNFVKFLSKNIAYQLNPNLFLGIMIPIIIMGVQSGLTNKDMTQNLTPALIRHVAAILQTISSWFGLEISWSDSDLESSGMPSFLQKAVNEVLPSIFAYLAYSASALFNTYGALAFANASLEAAYKFRAERDSNFRPDDAHNIRQLAFFDRLIKEYEAAPVDRIALFIDLNRDLKEKMLFEKNINPAQWDALMKKLEVAIIKAKVDSYTLDSMTNYHGGKIKEDIIYFGLEQDNERQYLFSDQQGIKHEGQLPKERLIELFGQEWQNVNFALKENADSLKEAIFRENNQRVVDEMPQRVERMRGELADEKVRKESGEGRGSILMHESGRASLRAAARSSASSSSDPRANPPAIGSVNLRLDDHREANEAEVEPLISGGSPRAGRDSGLLSSSSFFSPPGCLDAIGVPGCLDAIEAQADKCCNLPSCCTIL